MSAGSTGIPILTGYQAPSDQLQAAELSRVVNGTAVDAFDEFDLAQRNLDEKADELAAKQREVDDQREQFQQLHDTALAEVAHLKDVEEQRLKDEQVRLALEAQRREEQRRLAEQQAAEAAQRAAEEAQRVAAQQEAFDAQQAQEREADGAGRPGGDADRRATGGGSRTPGRGGDVAACAAVVGARRSRHGLSGTGAHRIRGHVGCATLGRSSS